MAGLSVLSISLEERSHLSICLRIVALSAESDLKIHAIQPSISSPGAGVVEQEVKLAAMRASLGEVVNAKEVEVVVPVEFTAEEQAAYTETERIAAMRLVQSIVTDTRDLTLYRPGEREFVKTAEGRRMARATVYEIIANLGIEHPHTFAANRVSAVITLAETKLRSAQGVEGHEARPARLWDERKRLTDDTVHIATLARLNLEDRDFRQWARGMDEESIQLIRVAHEAWRSNHIATLPKLNMKDEGYREWAKNLDQQLIELIRVAHEAWRSGDTALYDQMNADQRAHFMAYVQLYGTKVTGDTSSYEHMRPDLRPHFTEYVRLYAKKHTGVTRRHMMGEEMKDAPAEGRGENKPWMQAEEVLFQAARAKIQALDGEIRRTHQRLFTRHILEELEETSDLDRMTELMSMFKIQTGKTNKLELRNMAQARLRDEKMICEALGLSESSEYSVLDKGRIINSLYQSWCIIRDSVVQDTLERWDGKGNPPIPFTATGQLTEEANRIIFEGVRSELLIELRKLGIEIHPPGHTSHNLEDILAAGRAKRLIEVPGRVSDELQKILLAQRGQRIRDNISVILTRHAHAPQGKALRARQQRITDAYALSPAERRAQQSVLERAQRAVRETQAHLEAFLLSNRALQAFSIARGFLILPGVVAAGAHLVEGVVQGLDHDMIHHMAEDVHGADAQMEALVTAGIEELHHTLDRHVVPEIISVADHIAAMIDSTIHSGSGASHNTTAGHAMAEFPHTPLPLSQWDVHIPEPVTPETIVPELHHEVWQGHVDPVKDASALVPIEDRNVLREVEVVRNPSLYSGERLLPGLEIGRTTTETPGLRLSVRFMADFDLKNVPLYDAVNGHPTGLYFTADSQALVKSIVTVDKLVTVETNGIQTSFVEHMPWGVMDDPLHPGHELSFPLAHTTLGVDRASIIGSGGGSGLRPSTFDSVGPVIDHFGEINPETGQHIVAKGATAGIWYGTPADPEKDDPGSGKQQNVSAAARMLDGFQLRPGQELVFTEVVDITPGNGFMPGKAYMNGKITDNVNGGGTCAAGTAFAHLSAGLVVLLDPDRLQHALAQMRAHDHPHLDPSYLAKDAPGANLLSEKGGAIAGNVIDAATWDSKAGLSPKESGAPVLINPLDHSATLHAKFVAHEGFNQSIIISLETDSPLDPKMGKPIQIGPFVEYPHAGHDGSDLSFISSGERPRLTTYVVNSETEVAVKVVTDWSGPKATQTFAVVHMKEVARQFDLPDQWVFRPPENEEAPNAGNEQAQEINEEHFG